MIRCPVFTKPQLNLMKDYIRQSKGDGLERGFNIDGDADNVRFKDHCVGTECAIKITPRWGSYGTFHTHPKSGGIPSSMDTYGAVLQSHKVICIGTTFKRKPLIRCYVAKDYGSDKWYKAFEEAVVMQRDISDAIRYGGMSPEEAYAPKMDDIFRLVRDKLWGIYGVLEGDFCDYGDDSEPPRQSTF